MNLNIEKLYSMIDSHRVISFDIFDTLVVRNTLKPSDIFDIMEYNYNIKNANNVLVDFKKMRIDSENKARSKKKEEIYLKDIYSEMILKENVKEELIDLEITLEKKFIQPNYEMLSVYNYCKSKNKKIIITSDMYLPKEVIEGILKKCGYNEYYKLFLSSDVGYRKRSGSLFEYILKEINIESNQILHIGDNINSDVKQPKKYKIDSFHVSESHYKNKYFTDKSFNKNEIQNNVFLAYLKNNAYLLNTKEEKLGFSLLGLPLLNFCIWLKKHTQGINKYFLARDGYLIKQAYDTLFPDENQNSYYLYLSRNSLRSVCLYDNYEFDLFVEQLPGLRTYSKNNIFDFCRVSSNNEIILNEKYSNLIDVYSKRELKENINYRNLFNDIKKLENNQYKEQHSNFLEYLRSNNFKGDIAVVDVGWRGSAQVNLERICKNMDVDIKGYYFGVEGNKTNENTNTSQMYSYFWPKDKSNTIKNTFLNGRKGIFECMFLSQQGSTLKYCKDSAGKVIPILDNPSKVDHNIEILIQEGAMKFIEGFSSIISFIPDFNADEVGAGITNYMLNPMKEDLILGDIIVENYCERYLARPEKINYFLNPKKFLEDLRKAEWKVGFIKRLVPLPNSFSYILNSIYENIR